MKLDRRRMLTSLAATAVGAPLIPFTALASPSRAAASFRPLRTFRGEVDWEAVRALFPLSEEWTHLASFLLVSHPRPVAEAIDHYRKRIDADPVWVEIAALTDSEGRPFAAVKRAIAEYVGGQPNEICMTSNTTTALAMAYHGLRIRRDQEILTTEHDHYSHHESIRYAAERSGARVRYVALYDTAANANATQIVERMARAIRPSTRAVGVTWVHSSTGVKIPIAELAAVVARANRGRADADRCLLIVDGVHGFGAQHAQVARLGCDFFASGLHKWMFAPRGTGFLWGRRDAWPHMRPTIPAFDPDGMVTWDAWMKRQPLPPTQAAFVSPGGFVAFEHVLAIPAAFELHRAIGRDEIAARIDELSAAFKEGAAKIRGVTLHTPRDPRLSAGISCFEVAGLTADAVTQRLTAKKFRTTSSPYRTSYARVATGVMNTPAEIDRVLEAIRELAA
ncbi:MAG TPA: aminotransferase class V-fold PLP-dependent enzyme [Gemmatimonadaceae bacterium]|nr:aminotransferase class V-fold PLP-dependent enzyme [Gemmatimonadaceae bacterium]